MVERQLLKAAIDFVKRGSDWTLLMEVGEGTRASHNFVFPLTSVFLPGMLTSNLLDCARAGDVYLLAVFPRLNFKHIFQKYICIFSQRFLCICL